MQLGQHCLKSWSSTQATVALSSADAELYALTKGAAQALGMLSLLVDIGVELSGTVHTDASAAIGILRRKGLGKNSPPQRPMPVAPGSDQNRHEPGCGEGPRPRQSS